MTCAARDGGVTCFGKNALPDVALDAVALGVGSGFACAVTALGDIECWGDNTHGQLGSADAGSASATPVRVAGLDGGARSVSCGRAHSCAVVANYQVACWGEGAHYKLGNASTADQASAFIITQ
jgi:alpha-tubulin suppressor-like RCC1 family protein